MINYVPKIYQNELLSSFFTRMFTYSCYSSSIKFTKTIFERENENIDYCFYNCLNVDSKELIEKFIGIKNAINNHTLIKYYSLFLSGDELNEVYNTAYNFKTNISQKIMIPLVRSDKHLRYCPLCVQEHIETYFEILPQIYDIAFCPLHKCRFKETNIRISKEIDSVFKSIDEIDINYDDIEIIGEDDINIKIAKYVQDVLKEELVISDVKIGEFLTSKLEYTKYLSSRGERRNLNLLIKDLNQFYTSLENYSLTKNRLSRLMRDKEYTVFDALLVAYFLKINSREIINRASVKLKQYEIFDREVKKLYSEGMNMLTISRKMKCNKEVVRKVIIGEYD